MEEFLKEKMLRTGEPPSIRFLDYDELYTLCKKMKREKSSL